MPNSEYKVSVILNKELYTLIASEAFKLGLSKSAFIRMILTDKFKK